MARRVSSKFFWSPPFLVGLVLFGSSVSSLLRVYDALQEYRASAPPILEKYFHGGKVAAVHSSSSAPEPLDSDDRIRLLMDLHSFQSRVDADPAIRWRLHGGVVLMLGGLWLIRRKEIAEERERIQETPVDGRTGSTI